MIRHYLITAFRNIFKNPTQSVLNIVGLAIGLSCALLIFLWVQQQLQYDKWVDNRENIYRLETETWVLQPPYYLDDVERLPEIEATAPFYFWYQPTISRNEVVFTLKNFTYTDNSAFEVFNFTFIAGNRNTVFDKPLSIVLTKKLADKLFPDENPIGKLVKINQKTNYTVTGVINDVKNMHLEIEALASMHDETVIKGSDEFVTSEGSNFLVYNKIIPNTNIHELESKIFNQLKNKLDDDAKNFILRNYDDIYFNRSLTNENHVKHGNLQLVYLFVIVSIFILLIASINFINLTTAKAGLREKEIAIRKVSGCRKTGLRVQHLTESFIVVLLAYILSMFLVEMSLNTFQTLLSETIDFSYFNPRFIVISISLILITTLLAGLYPAFYLSNLKPTVLLKGTNYRALKGGVLRQILTIFQFSISISLIIATITVIKQRKHMNNMDLGYNQEQIISFKLYGDRFNTNYFDNTADKWNGKNAFSEVLKTNPNISEVSYLSQTPGNLTNTWSLTYDSTEISHKTIVADPNFIDVFDINLIKGRNFRDSGTPGLKPEFIINEYLANMLGIDDPEGKFINNGNTEIIGIVSDFHYNSLHSPIEPIVIVSGYWTSYACVKLNGNKLNETIKFIQSKYEEFCPGFPFDYQFIDEAFGKQYEYELRLSTLLKYFAFTAIALAISGLFSLSAFMAERRRKEIGIRKVMGASINQILRILTLKFTHWVIISFTIAAPVSYYLLQAWLKSYPYKTKLDWWIFLIPLFIALSLAILSVIIQTYKTANENPIESLKYE